MNTPNRITLTLRAADGQTLEPIRPFVQIGAHVNIGRGLAVIDQLQQPPALGGELDLVAYHCLDEYGQKKVLLPGAEGITRHIRRGSVLKQLTYMDSACRLQSEVERLRSALKFYADREHYHFESGSWDTVSGEPLNILWNGDEPDFIEDGTVARNALAEGSKS